MTVAFVDLDGFKAINDTYGHGTGDEGLRRIAASLARTGRTGDLHGRLGGDEFIVAAVLPPCTSGHNGSAGPRSPGVGVVTRETGTADFSVEEVLNDADQAMYAVKHATAPTTAP